MKRRIMDFLTQTSTIAIGYTILFGAMWIFIAVYRKG